MKKILLLTCTCIVLCLASCATDPTEVAKNIVAQRLTTETQGKIKLTEFTKINATKENVFGVELYEVEYRFTAVAVEDGGWILAMNDNVVWFWNVYDTDGDRFSKRHLIKNGEVFTSMPHCKITLKKTENGWVENQP
jgi:hypothetical protein